MQGGWLTLSKEMELLWKRAKEWPLLPPTQLVERKAGHDLVFWKVSAKSYHSQVFAGTFEKVKYFSDFLCIGQL